jgi:diguanylate cyclase (GGDEF)-like protein
LLNRRAFAERYAQETARAGRDATPLSVAVLDLDHFKAVNDRYGHAAGDEVLRSVARLARECFRNVDSVGRIGGEEFAVLLPGAPLHGAAAVVQRFADWLSATDVAHGPHTLRITATAGVAQRLPGEHALDTVLQRADAALYEGKHGGRNRVMLALPEGGMQRHGVAAPASLA